MNVVECDTWRVLVSRQFGEEEPHELVGLEDRTRPLRKTAQKCSMSCILEVYFVAATLTLISRSTALDGGIFTLAVGSFESINPFR